MPLVEVEPGQLYRSGQLAAAELLSVIDKHQIRTVINLRGVHTSETWFNDEFRLTEKLGIRFISLDDTVENLPHARNLRTLLQAFLWAPRPILIHCDTGIERTGQAAALYQMAVLNHNTDRALEMLSLNFAYLDGVSHPSKKYFIRDVWQGLDWAMKEYNPCVQDYQYYPHDLPECKDQSRVIVQPPGNRDDYPTSPR